MSIREVEIVEDDVEAEYPETGHLSSINGAAGSPLTSMHHPHGSARWERMRNYYLRRNAPRIFAALQIWGQFP